MRFLALQNSTSNEIIFVYAIKGINLFYKIPMKNLNNNSFRAPLNYAILSSVKIASGIGQEVHCTRSTTFVDTNGSFLLVTSYIALPAYDINFNSCIVT